MNEFIEFWINPAEPVWFLIGASLGLAKFLGFVGVRLFEERRIRAGELNPELMFSGFGLLVTAALLALTTALIWPGVVFLELLVGSCIFGCWFIDDGCEWLSDSSRAKLERQYRQALRRKAGAEPGTLSLPEKAEAGLSEPGDVGMI